MNLSAGGQPEHVLALPTEANFFSLLGVKPLLGRTWAAGEDQRARMTWRFSATGSGKAASPEIPVSSASRSS